MPSRSTWTEPKDQALDSTPAPFDEQYPTLPGTASQPPPAPSQLAARPASEMLGLSPESTGLLPMQHPAWVISCTTTLVPSSRLALTVAGDGRLSRALAPLCRSQSGPEHLELLGHAQTGEPGDLLWSDEAALQDLADRLARQPLAIHLERVPADSLTLAALRRAFHGRGVMLVRAATGTPTLRLDPSWVFPQDKFNAGRQSDLRRAERHARQLGDLSFEIHDEFTPQGLESLLDEAYAVEARSWKGECGSALLHDRMRGAFFRRYAHAAMRSGLLRLAFMRIGGVAVSMQIAVQWQDRYWLLKIGYDNRYANCSPGQLLMLYTVRHAAEQCLKSFEFLGSPAPWTQVWAPTLRPYVRLLAYPASAAAARSLAGDVARTLHQRLHILLNQGKAA